MNKAKIKSRRPKCRKLLTKNLQYRWYNFILDDESYFILPNTDMSGNDIIYSENKEKTSEKVKKKYKNKEI